MKRKTIIILSIAGIIAIALGFILLNKNNGFKNNKIEIIDATYKCNKIEELFYEDETNTYLFPCIQSDSVFVKFENGNKMLVTKALEDEKVTIDELIDAGLKVIKKKK